MACVRAEQGGPADLCREKQGCAFGFSDRSTCTESYQEILTDSFEMTLGKERSDLSAARTCDSVPAPEEGS